MVEIGEYDYKGQPKYKIRKVIADGEILSTMPTSTYRVDWVSSGTSCLYESTMLEGSYRTDIEYDALGRPVSIELPMDVNSSRRLVTPTYNRAGAMTAIMLDSDTYVSRIAYNAKGQKILSVLGCGLMTRHAYDPVNFRLLRQKTEAFTLSSLTYTPSSGSTKQDCAYTYDLAGNIVGMVDQTTECAVGGTNATNPDELIRIFEYDALYRLIYATGREAGSHVSTSDPNFRPTPDTSPLRGTQPQVAPLPITANTPTISWATCWTSTIMAALGISSIGFLTPRLATLSS